MLAGARRRAVMPTSQALFQDSDLLAFLSGQLHSHIVPLIKSKNDEYFVVHEDAALVAGTSEYRIPTRAQGGALRDVVVVDASGNEYELDRLQPEDQKLASGLSGVYLRDDKVVFYPALSNPPTGHSLRFKYERMPNNLVAATAAGRISSLNQGSLQIVVDNAPSTWGTSTTFDILLPVPLFTSIKDDQAISGITGTTINLSTWPTGIAVGQWISESRTSPLAQVPYEAHMLLEQLGAIKMLEALSPNELKPAKDAYKEMREDFLLTITPRIKGAPKKAVNRRGIFQAMRHGRWQGYR